MRGRISAIVWAAAAVLLTLSLVIYPQAAVEAAKDGLNLFLNVVFPSLLPFFILSEIMVGLGVVHFIGVLFEPLMRPLFNVPGEGAFVLSMGLAAGYPMDAVITGKFRRANMCSRVEGERMVAFSNTADPMLSLLRVDKTSEIPVKRTTGVCFLAPSVQTPPQLGRCQCQSRYTPKSLRPHDPLWYATVSDSQWFALKALVGEGRGHIVDVQYPKAKSTRTFFHGFNHFCNGLGRGRRQIFRTRSAYQVRRAVQI